jgi:hypothetical protein
MKRFILPLLLFAFTPFIQSNTTATSKTDTKPYLEGKIQVAILLDVSGSMDGLIEQAKSQLWNMVSVMGKATCNGKAPQIEIALYEYGRSTNEITNGYVKQISPFTTDLDKLSKDLFSLTTNGGDEYCGQAIFTSLSELKWDASAFSYKVIFIAGNEDFLQGKLHYTRACSAAQQKGVIVNTIFCGDKREGIRLNWRLGDRCGDGNFTNIDHNEKELDIPTPFDTTIYVLNQELNATYVHYGAGGAAKYADQASMDMNYFSMNKSVAAKRVGVKSKGTLYKNAGWDLIDAYAADSLAVERTDRSTLPKELRNKTTAEIKKVVTEKQKERSAIQKKIGEVSIKREAYIAAEKSRTGVKTGSTLETEIEKMIRQQAKRFNMIIE